MNMEEWKVNVEHDVYEWWINEEGFCWKNDKKTGRIIPLKLHYGSDRIEPRYKIMNQMYRRDFLVNTKGSLIRSDETVWNDFDSIEHLL